jgi:hypothetical protein
MRQVDFEIDMGGLNTFVPSPEGNGGDINACL